MTLGQRGVKTSWAWRWSTLSERRVGSQKGGRLDDRRPGALIRHMDYGAQPDEASRSCLFFRPSVSLSVFRSQGRQMTGQDEPLDIGAFVGTSALFQKKRMALGGDEFQVLARDILRRVSSMKHVGKLGPGDVVSGERIREFCILLTQPAPTAALDFIRMRKAEGVDHEAILHGYLAGAARILGERWEADELSFMDVIHASGHLYALLRALQPMSDPRRKEGSGGRHALFAVVPGETHTFGARIAAETFREAGWSIELKVDLDHDALVDHVQRTEPNIIGLSLSTQDSLPSLVRLAVALRLIRPRAIIGVAPALSMGDTAIQSVADVDLIFRDARQAVRDLDWSLKIRS